MTVDPSPSPETEVLQQMAWVRRLALAMVRDPGLADDAAQQVAASWLQRRPAPALMGGRLRAWLARAVRSSVVDRARAERSRRRREGCAAEDRGSASTSEGAAEVVLRHERQQRVAAAVQALPEPYRTTILHRYLDELPTAVVAARTGVPEATVRKRIERGLNLLRERLDVEFESRSRLWCLGLLEPALRRKVEAALGGGNAVVQGVGIMGSKVVAGIAGVVALGAVALWLLSDADGFDIPAEAGGRGVLVPSAVAEARQAQEVLRVAAVQDAPVGGTAAAPPVRVLGQVFVDGVHRAPSDLAIRTSDDDAPIQWDVGAATWSFDLAPVLERTAGQPGMRARATTLWITSSTTVPAQVPIPVELFHRGGALDLHLDTGRSLSLLFLDEETRSPLTALEFEVQNALELSRKGRAVLSRSSDTRHRTDESGRAVVHGLPERGHVSVLVDLARRDRQLPMLDGKVVKVRWPAQPVWSMPLDPKLPRQLDVTILAKPPLGDAEATGQVPAWAMSPGGPESVRVMVRERAKVGTDASGLGERYVLPTDAQGAFTLVAGAPSRHAVWIERVLDGAPLSTLAEVVFDRAGPQPPIVFTPLDGFPLAFRFFNVPADGRVEVFASGAVVSGQRQQHECVGRSFGLAVPVVVGALVQIRLLAADGGDGKSGWTRQLVVTADTPRELAIDLAGSWRRVELRGADFDVAAVRSISLQPCRAGRAVVDERIVVLCEGGRGTAVVRVAPGRWLFSAEAEGELVACGAVDVEAAVAEPLLLVPRLQRVPAEGLRPAFRFDSVDGVSLQDLPERLRTVRVSATATTVALPVDAVYVRLAR